MHPAGELGRVGLLPTGQPDQCQQVAGSRVGSPPIESVQPRPEGDRHLRTRTLDGSYNDLAVPTMGTIGARFGRNIPLGNTYPETPPDLLEPNPRLVSRRLLTRDEFKPATIVNVLAGAWLPDAV